MAVKRLLSVIPEKGLRNFNSNNLTIFMISRNVYAVKAVLVPNLSNDMQLREFMFSPAEIWRVMTTTVLSSSQHIRTPTWAMTAHVCTSFSCPLPDWRSVAIRIWQIDMEMNFTGPVQIKTTKLSKLSYLLKVQSLDMQYDMEYLSRLW